MYQEKLTVHMQVYKSEKIYIIIVNLSGKVTVQVPVM